MTATVADPIHVLTYPVSPGYVRSWTDARAVSEMVANAIDEQVEWKMTWESADNPFGGVLTVEDEGEGIPEEGLVIGLTSKAGNANAIGTHGEGSKLAGLILSRSKDVGRVWVDTVGYAYEPAVERHSLTNGAARQAGSKPPELLVYRIFPSSRTRGTRFTVEAPKSLYDEVRGRFLHFERGYEPPAAPGRVLTGVPGNRVYVGGVLVQDGKGDLLFSYDLALEAAKQLQNRDRSVIEGYALRRVVQDILRGTTDAAVLEQVARAALDGSLSETEQFFGNGVSYEQKHVWREVGRRVLGNTDKAFFIDSGSEEVSLDLRDQGYRKVEHRINQWQGNALLELMGASKASKLAVREPKGDRTEWVRPSSLTDVERENLDAAVRVVRGVWGWNALDQVKVYTANMVNGYDDGSLGFYSPGGKGRVAIRRSQLASLQDAVETLTHEAGHRLAHRERKQKHSWEYQDRTRGFESQLERMAAQAAMLLLEKGVMPEPVEPEPQAVVDARPESTEGRAGLLVEHMVGAGGWRSSAAFCRETLVKPAQVGRLRNGKGLMVPEDVEFICGRLGLSWGVVFLAANCDRLEHAHESARSRKSKRRGWAKRAATPTLAAVLAAGSALRSREADMLCQRLRGLVEGRPVSAGDTVRGVIDGLLRLEVERLGLDGDGRFAGLFAGKPAAASTEM